MLALAGLAALVYGSAGPWIVTLWVGEHAVVGQMPYAVAGTALFFIALSKWPAELAYALMNTRRLVTLAALEMALKLSIFLLIFSNFGYLSPLIAIVIVHMCGVSWLYIRLGQSTVGTRFR